MNQARPTQIYDVAVLGPSLPGLVAAALLAQRGLRVLHVASTTAGQFESGGWLLPTAPELLPPLKSQPALRETLDELALSAGLGRSLRPLAPQLVLPGARLQLGEENEPQRAFGPDAAPLDGALTRLANTVEETEPVVRGAPLLPHGLGERLSRWRHLRANRSLLESPLVLDGAGPLEQALLALHRFAAADEARPDALAFARATAPLLRGLHRLDDGGLRAQLVGHVRARRGDALVAKVEGIEVERGRFAALRIRGEPWRARALLAAMPAGDLVELLPEGRRKAKVAAQAAEATSIPVQVLNRVVAEEGLPRGLGQVALVAGFGKEPALLEVRPAQRADGKVDETARTLTVASRASGEELEALLEEVLPFHGRHLRHEAPSPEGARIFRLETERRWGFEGLAPRTALPNLLLAGPELLPGLGLEGGFLAGRDLARTAAAIVGKGR